MIGVVVNGEAREVQDGASLRDLLDELAIGTKGIAVELNREIIPKGRHATTVLQEGDKVEVIQMVGGG
ncbi:MAG: sulfur carrier protein ThiS [Thermodesulfobacteriota bacterium]